LKVNIAFLKVEGKNIAFLTVESKNITFLTVDGDFFWPLTLTLLISRLVKLKQG